MRLVAGAKKGIEGALMSFNYRLVRLVDISNGILYITERFQFQIGAIGSQQLTTFLTVLSSFNSRLVRLVAFVHPVQLSYQVFQFQIGAIGSMSPEISSRGSIPFQFQIGAIGSACGTRVLSDQGVSIPDWCDW